MCWIRRCGIWLSRIGHAQGFGIQSPHDFRFVREVIGEKNPYYAYKAIARRCERESRLTEHLSRLYFRLANFVQPDVIKILCPKTNLWTFSMRMACHKADFQEMQDTTLPLLWSEDKKYLILMEEDTIPTVLPSLDKIPDGSVMVVNGIYQNERPTAAWKQLIQHDQPRIVFDLYHCGILFFDKKRYKEYYTINF